jgi:ParB-like nuclease domain
MAYSKRQLALCRSALEFKLEKSISTFFGKGAAEADLKQLIDRWGMKLLSKASVALAHDVREGGNEVLHARAADADRALSVIEATRKLLVELSRRWAAPHTTSWRAAKDARTLASRHGSWYQWCDGRLSEGASMDLQSANLDPAGIWPVNQTHDTALLVRLTAGMVASGWTERALLVEEEPSGGRRYFAWTGSHRIQAARDAGLATVPCRVLERGLAEQAFRAAGYDLGTYQCWRDAIGRGRGDQERRRLDAAKAAALSETVRLLEEEQAAQDGHAW